MKSNQTDRRNFLRRAVVATGATTAAAASLATGAHDTHQPVVKDAADGTPKHKGYQETEHVHTYYRLARS